MIRVNIWGKGIAIGASRNHELFTRPLKYSSLFFQNLNVDNQVFNFVVPRAGQEFVISGLAISGNRDIGVNGSIVDIYATDSASNATATGGDIGFEVPKSTVLPFIEPNFLIAEGLFINGKCDDNSVRVNLFGYFVKTTGELVGI